MFARFGHLEIEDMSGDLQLAFGPHLWCLLVLLGSFLTLYLICYFINRLKELSLIVLNIWQSPSAAGVILTLALVAVHSAFL